MVFTNRPITEAEELTEPSPAEAALKDIEAVAEAIESSDPFHLRNIRHDLSRKLVKARTILQEALQSEPGNGEGFGP